VWCRHARRRKPLPPGVRAGALLQRGNFAMALGDRLPCGPINDRDQPDAPHRHLACSILLLKWFEH